jgi:hypothetical protein
VELGVSYPSLHSRVVLVDPLHLIHRSHPPDDDAEGPVRRGTAQDDQGPNKAR